MRRRRDQVLISVAGRLGESTQLSRDVRAGTPHSASFGECSFESTKCLDDHVAIRFPPSTFALVDPFGGCEMSTLTVAAPTGGDFVLDDARPALDTWNEVFGGGFHQMDVDRTPTPHALGAVAFEDEGHPLSPVELASFLAHRAISPDEHT